MLEVVLLTAAGILGYFVFLYAAAAIFGCLVARPLYPERASLPGTSYIRLSRQRFKGRTVVRSYPADWPYPREEKAEAEWEEIL